MGYKGLKGFSAVAAVGACAVMATYYGWLASRHLAPVQPLMLVYQFVLLVLLATWVVADGELRGRDRPTFDQGVFVIFLFLVYVPWYLFATRRVRGLLIFVGMLLLANLPETIAAIVSSLR